VSKGERGLGRVQRAALDEPLKMTSAISLRAASGGFVAQHPLDGVDDVGMTSVGQTTNGDAGGGKLGAEFVGKSF